MHPYLDWPGPIPFAHRGGASDNPENTMPAFQHAVDLGYTYLETDVHATSDGVLVAFHDPDLSRTCGRDGTIDSMTARDVASARVDGREPIPLFEELVGSFPEARFNIDCKPTVRSSRSSRRPPARLPRPGVHRRVRRPPHCAGSAPRSATVSAAASVRCRSRHWCSPDACRGAVRSRRCP
jgi:hypothetical protein